MLVLGALNMAESDEKRILQNTKHRFTRRPIAVTVHFQVRGEGLLTQMAFVPQNFDAGTLLLRLMGWLLTQGPLTRRNLTQGGF